jgi:hypothetical protein
MSTEVSYHLSVQRSALLRAFGRVRQLAAPKSYSQTSLTFDGTRLLIDYSDTILSFTAHGTWRDQVVIPARFLLMLAQVPPDGDPIDFSVRGSRLIVGSSSVVCLGSQHKALDPIQVQVEKAAFLEIGRLFKLYYRHRARSVTIELVPGQLSITFCGDGGHLKCHNTAHHFIAEVPAASFARIVSAHRHEKAVAGPITLTFRPSLSKFDTPLAGSKAKFRPSPEDDARE